MLSKLIKYDFRSLSRFGIPTCIIAVSLGFVGSIDAFFSIRGLFTGMDDGSTSSIFESVFSSIGIIALIFIFYAILLCFTVMQIGVYINFYKTLCTDEGYLTFTLPVKERDILLSKSLNALIWGVLVAIAIVISIGCIILAVYFGGASAYEPPVTEPDTSLFPDGSFTDAVPVILLLLLTAIIYTVNVTQLIFLAIFLASVISKKNRGLAAIGMVLAVNFIYSIVASLVSMIISASLANLENSFEIQMLIYIVLLAISGLAYFFITKRMMERKLNLP